MKPRPVDSALDLPELRRVMPLWEYLNVEITRPWDDHLDDLGSKGWELIVGEFVSRKPENAPPYEVIRAIFKRPILD